MARTGGGIPCSACGQLVPWATVAQAAGALRVSARYVRELLADGRFPNAYKYQPPTGESAFWRIPLVELEMYATERGTPFISLAGRAG
jgi:hypothetical protein